MEPYRRQQFDALLHTAVERYVETLVQRCEGARRARDLLLGDPGDERVRLGEFVDAVFADFLLDGPAGACFVLEALGSRPWPAGIDEAGETGSGGSTRVADVLDRAARRVFGSLLAAKTDEALQHQIMFEPTGSPSTP